MNSNKEYVKVAEEFARWSSDQFNDFNEFLILYDYSEKIRQLLEATAKRFFSDLFWIYIDRIIQNASRLTDPPKTRKNRNFLIRSIHNYFIGYSEYDAIGAEKLIISIETEAEKVRLWRNKLISHYDQDIALDKQKVVDKFILSNFKVLYDNLEKYVSLLYKSFDKAFKYIHVSGSIDLIGALKESYALNEIKERDINLYDNIMKNSPFYEI